MSLENTRDIGTAKVVMVGGGGGLPENPLSTLHGGTGNAEGYIRTGHNDGTTIGHAATIEGEQNEGSGHYSHVEGWLNSARGNYSHVGGHGNTADYADQTVIGKYNRVKDSTLLEIGNGVSSSARSNALEVYNDGKVSWDNGATKFKFTQHNGEDGYYDASGTFHAFGDSGSSTLSDLTDTSISNPSTGQTIEYNSTSGKWENKLSTAVVANPSGTASTDLTKIKVGETTYNIPSGGGLPETPLSIAHGGTGNTVGYIRTGQKTNTTMGSYATAEGSNNTTSGTYSHGEGRSNTASGNSSHAEGNSNTASGLYSHSEGGTCTASGDYSHAQGYSTTASGTDSCAMGNETVAGYTDQTVVGKWNSNKATTYFEVGNGSAGSRSNAFEVYSDGKISCDNGSSKFQFTQSDGANGYYDASGTFHQFGSSTLAGLSDVNLSLPSDGDVLTFGSNGWTNGYGGNTKRKTRYTISSSYWSASPNSDGFYTYTLSLSPHLNTDYAPTVNIAGSSVSTQATDTERTMYSYVRRCRFSGDSSLVLYATTKPTSTFYIYVDGVTGSGIANTVGNVIQPNGAVSGGINTTLFFRSEALKSRLVKRDDDKGYATGTGAWSAGLSASQIQEIENSNMITVNCYGYMPGLGLRLMGSYTAPPSKNSWFFSIVNQIIPERWIQAMRNNNSWENYAIVSNDIYNQMSSTDVALAWEIYLLA